MDASVVGIRLASGVVTPLLKKLFHAEGAGEQALPPGEQAGASWRR
ncbi:hypothetical protein OTB20_13095 [Streptomyces sp. H27-H1]|nr:hypothetical protein [Streptomyces sp. H27-H1]MCY0927124.1 hypothetical protein [Streptomyces sp. H27-H1]